MMMVLMKVAEKEHMLDLLLVNSMKDVVKVVMMVLLLV